MCRRSRTYVRRRPEDIQRRPKPLDGRDGTSGTVKNPGPRGPAAFEAEHGANEYRQHRAAETMIPGEGVAQPVRQRQHPLGHGQAAQHPINQMRSLLGHSAAAA